MTEDEFEIFHGERRKRGLVDFFDEGTVMKHETTPGENPYWEETKRIYYEQPPKLQKTYRLTTIYYQKLKKEHKHLFYIPVKSLVTRRDSNDGSTEDTKERDETVRLLRKRAVVTQNEESGARAKKRKVDFIASHSKERADGSTVPNENAGSTESPLVPPAGPLLQLPTGSAKVYTRLSADKTKVWKGPYKQGRMNLVLFFHRAMRDVLGDAHTLEVECRQPYLAFPLLKGARVGEIEITKRDFNDVISKVEVREGDFVLRESLGVLQCHKMGADRLKNLPVTFWVHFVWRFCLNVGDTGLYNAITDDELSFVFGIDMEERRARVAENSLVGFLFCKMPAKAYVQEIWNCLKTNKTELEKLVNMPVNYAGLDRLAEMYNASFDRALFVGRLKLVREAVNNL